MAQLGLEENEELVLTEWKHLEYTLNKLSQRNYARIAERGAMMRQRAGKAGEITVL